MAGGSGSPIRAVLYAFGANLGIAVAKSVAAWFTGSSSMLAEAIHSYADSGNQVLLLIGMHRARRPADAEHPLGYGKVSYFWSFLVAIMLFTLGGMFSIYEGWHKLADPRPLAHAWVALLVLGGSIVLESLSMYGCMVEVNKIRRGRSLWRWLEQSRSSELVVVFGEDLAALVGLVVAFAFLSLAAITGDPRLDALGSMCIGAVLLVVSVFVAVRVKALLIGRSADPDLRAAVAAEIENDADIVEVYNVITVQMGPQVVLAAKVRVRDGLDVGAACRRINVLEERLKSRFPDIGWCFMEMDVAD